MSGEFAVNRDERGRNVVEPWLRPQSQTIDGWRRQICADRAQIHSGRLRRASASTCGETQKRPMC
jgi:hypothetical protein